MSEETNTCPPAAPKQDRMLCKDGTPHDFVRQKDYPKDAKQKQLPRVCAKCMIEEFKAEICKHCRFFVANSILGLLPQAGMTDSGYCSKHRTLYADIQPACVQYTKFVPVWRRLLLHETNGNGKITDHVGQDEEKEKWKNKKKTNGTGTEKVIENAGENKV